MRGIFDKPMIFLWGKYPIQADPTIGTKWCSQKLVKLTFMKTRFPCLPCLNFSSKKLILGKAWGI